MGSTGNDVVKPFSPSELQQHTSGKIFVGGLPKKTSEDEFTKHFRAYGEIMDSEIVRGFGYVTFADPSVVDKVIEEPHVINGKEVHVKRSMTKGQSKVESADFRTKKIYVGRIPSTVSDDEFRDFFKRFGDVKDYKIKRYNDSPGFGFITFNSEKAVYDVLALRSEIKLAGSLVTIQKAVQKKENPPPRSFELHNDRNVSGLAVGSCWSRDIHGARSSASEGNGGSLSVGGCRSGGIHGGRSGASGVCESKFVAMGPPYRVDPSLKRWWSW